MQPRPTFRLKLAILRNRNFLAYWTSGNLSFVGDMFGMFAMQMLVMHLTGGDAAAISRSMPWRLIHWTERSSILMVDCWTLGGEFFATVQ